MNKKLSYEAPRTTAYKIEASSAILAASGGWTNSDKEHGFDIVEEDVNNPYDDNDFESAAECITISAGKSKQELSALLHSMGACI